MEHPTSSPNGKSTWVTFSLKNTYLTFPFSTSQFPIQSPPSCIVCVEYLYNISIKGIEKYWLRIISETFALVCVCGVEGQKSRKTHLILDRITQKLLQFLLFTISILLEKYKIEKSKRSFAIDSTDHRHILSGIWWKLLCLEKKHSDLLIHSSLSLEALWVRQYCFLLIGY